ncbi:MAG: 1-deoxy-D-xylulose-5-phosphate reductoisomerase [Coriobacteriia bacterium]|nr:1-deoxy-D-xylulose-5-phosphate reductoisomerase [Coriobacteriia bacterium]
MIVVSQRRKIAILGSTGSIGRQALEVVAAHPDQLEVVLISAHRSAELVAKQATQFKVPVAVLTGADPVALPTDLPHGLRLYLGSEALAEAIATSSADLVLNALVGAAGLRATLATLEAGATLALANKESLVIGGELPQISEALAARPLGSCIIPVDSEHSAIFQCLLGEDDDALKRIWLTASGGPFYGCNRSELATKMAADALRHPTWTMGPKITIDSATLMNKGLEIIEAHHLFNCPYDAITPVIHRQSIIHSAVALKDGAVKAQLGMPDMRVPIQLAFSLPQRWHASPESPADLDLFSVADLTFAEPDLEAFACLALAQEAGRAGGSAPVVLNAANEVANEAFREDRCGFLDIEALVRDALDHFPAAPLESVDCLEEIDASVRRHVGLKLVL